MRRKRCMFVLFVGGDSGLGDDDGVAFLVVCDFYPFLLEYKRCVRFLHIYCKTIFLITLVTLVT